MALYRNIRTGVTYEYGDKHWKALPNKHHYEKVEDGESTPSAPPPKKKKFGRGKKK